MMENIPLMIPSLDENDIQNAVRVLRSGQLIQGKEVEKLENSIANYLNVSHAICVSNGTATLHLALIALGIKSGDEVIVPALSYIATANVVELIGAKPIFVDIDLDTFCINTQLIEKAITGKTKAIIPVHEFGLMADMKEIKRIANKHNLVIIEDAACALGATQDGMFSGTVGDVGSFSLHPRKAITSGEGGILVTNNNRLAAKLRILRNHGVEYIDGNMEFVEAGFNYRLTDFQAALVHGQLERFPEILNQRQSLSKLYLNQITNSSIKLPVVPLGMTHTWQTFHIVWQGSVSRDAAIAYLRENGIGCNYGAQCMPDQVYFKNKYKLDANVLFPNAMTAFKQGIALPLYDKLSENHITYIVEQINKLK